MVRVILPSLGLGYCLDDKDSNFSVRFAADCQMQFSLRKLKEVGYNHKRLANAKVNS